MEEGVERVVSEKSVRESGNGIIAFIVGILLLAILIIFIYAFSLNTSQTVIFAVLVIGFYIVVISFLFEHRLIREIVSTITHTKENPPVIHRIDRPVIYEVEKPIIKPVITPVDRPVFLKNERLNIPKFDYCASSETMTYHSRNCRLGKLIKKKYKIMNNSPGYFIKKGFRPCKVCIQKIKKV